jgi:hypothetical protein
VAESLAVAREITIWDVGCPNDFVFFLSKMLEQRLGFLTDCKRTTIPVCCHAVFWSAFSDEAERNCHFPAGTA